MNKNKIKNRTGLFILAINTTIVCATIYAGLSKPNYGSAANNIAKANGLFLTSNFQQASNLYEQSAELMKSAEAKSRSYGDTAHAQLMQKNHVQALNSITKSIRSNPSSATAYQILKWIVKETPTDPLLHHYFNSLQKIDNVNLTYIEGIAVYYAQRLGNETLKKQFIQQLEHPLGGLLRQWF